MKKCLCPLCISDIMSNITRWKQKLFAPKLSVSIIEKHLDDISTEGWEVKVSGVHGTKSAGYYRALGPMCYYSYFLNSIRDEVIAEESAIKQATVDAHFIASSKDYIRYLIEELKKAKQLGGEK